ncbi:transcription factor A, mitochondrial-like [Centruroides vittatus]|uniref:transcription factor A, mitochondrial-like n=1 Tax=Centruroides vittatus TaxID=120091 RepID=UPI00350F5F6B
MARFDSINPREFMEDLNIKRPTSSFLYFYKEQRQNQNRSSVKKLAKVWKSESNFRREKFEIMALNDRLRYWKEKSRLNFINLSSEETTLKRPTPPFLHFVKYERLKRGPTSLKKLGKVWRSSSQISKNEYKIMALNDQIRYWKEKVQMSTESQRNWSQLL